MLRLSFEGFEALAARNPSLGRDILLDLGRILSARLRRPGRADAGVDGLMAPDHVPELHPDPEPHPGPGLALHAGRLARRRARRRRAADRGPRHGPVRDVEGHHPDPPAAVSHRARPVAQPVPAGRVQPDAARAEAHEGADRAELAQGIRLRHRLQPVHRVRRPAPVRPRRQRRLLRAAAAGRDGRRVHRRHVPEGQERLVLDDLPAAAGPAHLRPDAARAGRQRALPAVRRLRQELLRLQPARRLPGRSQRRRPVLERLPALLRRRLPGPRARVLRGPRGLQPRDPRRHGALRGDLDRRVRHAQRVHQDEHAHDHQPVRRDRVQHLLHRGRAGR